MEDQLKYGRGEHKASSELEEAQKLLTNMGNELRDYFKK